MFSTSFPEKSVISRITAKMLIEVEAVRFSAKEPFKFTSGWASPVYIDCRKLISYPRVRHTLMDFAASEITRNIGFESIDSIAGGETAGIPFAAWMADRLMLPMQYVRKQPKGFGRDAQIEGHLKEGERVLLVEDLTTDGRSKANFCKALRGAGAIVEHVFVVFHYDIFDESKQVMDDMEAKIETMLNKLKSESDSNLDEILKSVKEVSEMMENIKVASQEQAEGVAQINKTISDMDRITQENSALVEQNSAASQHMAQEAAQLQTLINEFKVDEDQSGAIENSTEKIEKDKLELRHGKVEQIPEYTEIDNMQDPPEELGNKTLPDFK